MAAKGNPEAYTSLLSKNNRKSLIPLIVSSGFSACTQCPAPGITNIFSFNKLGNILSNVSASYLKELPPRISCTSVPL